jgi:hypothetical protein
VKKLLTEWRNYLKEEESLDPELYGNCGTLAVALLQEAINRGIKGTEVVLVVDSDPELDSGSPSEEFDIYHTAIYRNGKYYDTRGEISREEVGSVAPLGLTTDSSEKPKEGRDYLVFSYVIDNSDSLDYIKEVIDNNTNWTNTCEFYGDRATKFWDTVE